MANEYYRSLMDSLITSSGGGKGSQRTTREQVTARLERLPMAHPLQALTQLTQLLEAMLEQPWNGAERVRALRLFETPMRPLSAGVQAQIATESYPLPKEKMLIAVSLLALQQRLGDGWCAAACETCSAHGTVSWFARRRVTLALNEALRHQCAALLLAYQLGREPPAAFWDRLRASYGLAAELGLQHRRQRDWIGGRDASAHARYVGALLLAMANPYGFQQRDLLDVATAISVLSVHVTLHDNDDTVADGERMDADDCASDSVAPPRGAPLSDAESLDVAAALAALDAASAAVTGADAEVKLGPARGTKVRVKRAVAVQLAEAWRGTSRSHRRLPATHVLATLSGLHALHRTLADGQDFDTFVQALDGASIEMGADSGAAAWLSGGGRGNAGSFNARVLDQSIDGYRLQWPAERQSRVKVGDLIGLSPQAEDSAQSVGKSWFAGVVRWLQDSPQHGLTVGVSLLARQPRAAAVRSLDVAGNRSRPLRALVLSDDFAGDALVVPKEFDRDAQMLELSCGEDRAQRRAAMHGVQRVIDRIEPISARYDRISLADVPAPATHDR